jgi:hypothetical protein
MKIVAPRFVLSIFFFFILSGVFARKLTVCTSGCGYASVQSAVNAAAEGDTVFININGVFTENRIHLSKNIVITGLGEDLSFLQAHEMRGASLHRIFYIDGGAVVVIENMTLQNGRETADPTSWKGSGGGMLIDGSATAVTLNHVRIRHCDNAGTGVAGGGITLGGVATSLSLNDCLLDNNISDNGGGGGIYLGANAGDLFVRSTAFQNNIAANGNGGAVLAAGNTATTFIGCIFTGNQALNNHSGGAFYAHQSLPAFNNCLFSKNEADKDGGAMKVCGGDIANCSFYSNTAANGGAISRGTETAANELYITSCTLLNNTATGDAPAGAGLHNASPTAVIHMVNTVIDKSTSGTDLYLYAANSLGTNQKNRVGKARFTTGSVRFETN